MGPAWQGSFLKVASVQWARVYADMPENPKRKESSSICDSVTRFADKKAQSLF